jgi:hypothetical protein
MQYSILASAVLVGAISATTLADQIIISPAADNTLIEDVNGNYSCGAAGYFFAGRVGVNGGSSIRRGAIRFNLSAITPFSEEVQQELGRRRERCFRWRRRLRGA